MSLLLRTCEACAAVLAYGGLAPEALDFALNSFKVHSQTSHKMRKLGGDHLKARTCPSTLEHGLTCSVNVIVELDTLVHLPLK